jgi:hypothetical protein
VACVPFCCLLQIFWLLKESELTPSGANLLDGRFAVFGYITQNQSALGYTQVSKGVAWCGEFGYPTLECKQLNSGPFLSRACAGGRQD